MSISLLSNLKINMKAQTNERDAFSTIAEMKAFREEYLPDMYDSFCYETGLKYRFNRSNPIDEITGKWRLLEGGSGDLSSYYTKTQTNNLLDEKIDKVSGKDLSTNDFTDAYKQQIDDNETAIETLNGDSTVNGSVDKKVASCLTDGKSYTDISIQNAIKQTAIVCDAKPTISGTTITYYQDGVEKTVTSDNKTKFYYTDNNVNFSTIWINSKEFTDTIASVDFADYVSKTNDVVNTYTGSEADKTKIPSISSLDALKALVDTDVNGKVSTAQGIANEGKILQVNDEGNLVLVDPSSMGNNASDVSYENASYPTLDNVKKALDNLISKVYYEKIVISSLSVSPSSTIYEIGNEISELQFAWNLNKTPITQTFNGTSVDNDVRAFTYDTPFSTNKSFKLVVSDGTESAEKSINIQFQNQIFYGSANIPQDYNSAFILGLSNHKFNNSTYKGSFNITIGNGEYGFICCPKSWNIKSVCKIGGFDTELVKENAISFTNSSGGVVVYDIVRTTRSGLGSITMVFE